MSEFAHYAEHSVVKKYEGAYGRKRKIAITLYILCPILLLFGMLALIGAGAFIWFVPLCPFFLFLIIPATYNRYFKIEYDYRIAAGEFNIAEVYNNKSRKEKINFKVSSAEIIAPYRDRYRESANRVSCDVVYDASSSLSSEDLYFAIYPDEKDENKKIMVFFEPTNKMLALLHLYNKFTVVTKVKY